MSRLLGWGSLILAVVLGLALFRVVERHPRSDDGVVSAAIIGVAPRVSGPIIELPVRDNQWVASGELLFRIDPAPYQLAAEMAEANLALALGQEANALRAIAAQEKQILAAEAVVTQARTLAREATDTYERIAPLLPQKFASAEAVETARNAMFTTEAGVVAAQAELEAMRAAVADPASAAAAVGVAAVALAKANLAVADCEVRAPFPGRVTGMNLAVGAFARAGLDTFPFIDTRQWFVVAPFRETELRRIRPGMTARVEIMTAPGQFFDGMVESTTFGVTPLPQNPFPSLPMVLKELDWVRLSQHFPVRILLPESVPPELLRVGATATATILSTE